MAKKPTIRPLKIKELEDADRAFEQITESVNGLLGGVHLTEVVYTKGFRVGALVKVPHKQNQTPSGVISGNGLRLVIESIDKNFVNLRVEPWYVCYEDVITSDTNVFDVTGLDSERDEEYKIKLIQFDQLATGDTIVLQPNATDDGFLESQRGITQGTAQASAGNIVWSIKSGTNFQECQFDIWLRTKIDGSQPKFVCIGGYNRNDINTGDCVTHHSNGVWRTTDVPIHSLRFLTNGSDGFQVNSEILVEKKVPTQTDIRILVY